MALILDKTITGVTATDNKGNITTGYTNLTYVESGITYKNPYLVITSIFIAKYLNNLTNQLMNPTYNGISAIINVCIYSDKESRTKGEKPIFQKTYDVNSRVIYDAYFLAPNIEDVNIFKKAYEYISTLYPNWKSDE